MVSTMLVWSATPLPAISKAVPWSTEARTKGNPRLTLTLSSKPCTLIGYVPLVVVHRQHNVVVATDGLVEYDVRGDGAFGDDASFLGVPDGGGDGNSFLVAQQSAVAGVGVEGRGGDSGSGEAPLSEAVVG